MTARQMEGGLLTAMAAGREGRRRLCDYLANEVLARQPSTVRRFLEETAILNEWLEMLPRSLYSDYPQLTWMKRRVLTETGAPEQAVEHFEAALEPLARSGDQEMAARSLHDKAFALRLCGQLQTGLDVLRQVLDLSNPQVGPKIAIYPLALCEAGVVSTLLGDLE